MRNRNTVLMPATANFANAFPPFISFKTGGLITGLLGIAIQPWRLLATRRLHLHVAARFSGDSGSDRLVLVVDYWLVRRRELHLDLYTCPAANSAAGTCAHRRDGDRAVFSHGADS